MKKNALYLSIIISFSFLFFNCEKDDNTKIENEEIYSSVINDSVFIATNEEIHNSIKGFINSKTNGTLTVILKNNQIKFNKNTKTKNYNNTMGNIDLSKSIVVRNKNNIKYTFLVNSNAGNEVINLIIVKTDKKIIEYFIKYTFDDLTNVVKNEVGAIDMNYFKGTIKYYNSNGDEFGKIKKNKKGNFTVKGASDPCNYGDVENGNLHSGDNNTDNSNTGNNEPSNNDGSTSGGGSGSSEEGSITFLKYNYAPCGCGGKADGHAPSGAACCKGSPLVSVDLIVLAKNSIKKSTTDYPCSGNTGVIIDLCKDDNFVKNYEGNCIEDKIDLDPSFENKPKAKCTYEQLNKNETIKNLLKDFFGDDADYDLNFKVVKDLICSGRSDVKGCTTQNTDGSITISIDEEYIDDTQTPTLFIAQTLLHEAIHANLYTAVKKLNNGVTPANSDFGILYEEYRQKREWQHELMADKYVNLIANGLREVHSLLNDQAFINDRNNNFPDWSWDDFYKEVAWQGLYGTTKGQEHINAPEYRNNSNLYIIDTQKGLISSTKTPNCNE